VQKRQVYENDRQQKAVKGRSKRYLCRGMAESNRVYRMRPHLPRSRFFVRRPATMLAISIPRRCALSLSPFFFSNRNGNVSNIMVFKL